MKLCNWHLDLTAEDRNTATICIKIYDVRCLSLWHRFGLRHTWTTVQQIKGSYLLNDGRYYRGTRNNKQTNSLSAMATKPQTKKNIERATTRTVRTFTWSRTKQIAQKNVIVCIFRPHGALNQLSLFLMNSFLISTSFLHVLWLFINPEETPEYCTVFKIKGIHSPFAVDWLLKLWK